MPDIHIPKPEKPATPVQLPDERVRTSQLDALRGQMLARQEQADLRIAKMQKHIADLATHLDKLTKERAEAAPKVWNWTEMNREQAEEAWRALFRWFKNVLIPRFPQAAYDIGLPCWYLHPTAVEHMSALYQTWCWAYTDKGTSPTRVAEWLDRWLPAAVQNIKDVVKLCNSGEHRIPEYLTLGHRGPGPDVLSQFLREDLAKRPPAPPKQPPPQPNPEG